jgi:hypothetical protein
MTFSSAGDGNARDTGRKTRGDVGKPARKGFVPARRDSKDGKNAGRNSLRIGNRGGRTAQRRGSLKKRDRSSQKFARAEAAIERMTVYLPE